MKKRIESINGMPVEIPVLDEHGEAERRRLNELALQEYQDSGTLSGTKLQEANEQFLEEASAHILPDDPEGKD